MKKLVVLVVVVLLCVAGWAGATYVVSSKVEHQYYTVLEQNARWGPVTLTSQSYQRGVFSSKAETLLEMAVPKTDLADGEEPSMESVQLLFEHTLYHGPLPLVPGQSSLTPGLAIIDTRLVRFDPDDDSLEELLQDVPELRSSISRTRVAFDGSMNGLVEIPAFEVKEENEYVRWGGFTATADYATGTGTLVGTVDMPSMELRFDDGYLVWEGMRGNFDLAEPLPLLYVGASEMVFGAMEMDMTDAELDMPITFQTEEFKVVNKSRFDGSQVHASQSLSFDGMTFDGDTYGPLAIDVEVKNMDGEALSAFQQKIMEVYRQADIYDPDELTAEILPLYSDLLIDLLAGNPELNIARFYVATPMGEADGNFQMKFDSPPGQAPQDLGALLQSIQYLQSSADISVDKSLAYSFMLSSARSELEAVSGDSPLPYSDEEIEMMVSQQLEAQIDMMTAQGLIVVDGEKIKSNATFNGGELLVNGQPMPIFGP